MLLLLFSVPCVLSLRACVARRDPEISRGCQALSFVYISNVRSFTLFLSVHATSILDFTKRSAIDPGPQDFCIPGHVQYGVSPWPRCCPSSHVFCRGWNYAYRSMLTIRPCSSCLSSFRIDRKHNCARSLQPSAVYCFHYRFIRPTPYTCLAASRRSQTQEGSCGKRDG
jgi:hypothetical protein